MTGSITSREIEQVVMDAASLVVDRLNSVKLHSSGHARNLVTDVDNEINAYLTSRLAALLPGSAILSEEASPPQSLSPHIKSRLWIIDPIDGTTNLLYGNPHFAVSVALACEGHNVAGVVYNPNSREMFTADLARGAFRNGVRISVNDTDILSDALVSFGVPYDPRLLSRTGTVIDSLLGRCRDLRRSGSSALDLCYIACGRFDAHVEITLSPWDTAAAGLILTEAGGTLTNWRRERRSVLAPDSVLASNSHLHDQLATLINRTAD